MMPSCPKVGDVLLLMGVVALSLGRITGFRRPVCLGCSGSDGSIGALLGTLMAWLDRWPHGQMFNHMHLWLDEAMEGPNPADFVEFSGGHLWCLGAAEGDAAVSARRSHRCAADCRHHRAIGGALVAIAQVDISLFSYGTTSYLGLVFVAIAVQQPIVAVLRCLPMVWPRR